MTCASIIVRPELSLDGSVDELCVLEGAASDAAVTPPGGECCSDLGPEHHFDLLHLFQPRSKIGIK